MSSNNFRVSQWIRRKVGEWTSAAVDNAGASAAAADNVTLQWMQENDDNFDWAAKFAQDAYRENRRIDGGGHTKPALIFMMCVCSLAVARAASRH